MPVLSRNNLSAVSWGSIVAGAAAAAALSFVLVLLGFGFGLLSVSPWSAEGASAELIGFGSIAWLVVIQLAAAGLGGYLTGRLRVRWPDIHASEVYFRDTAHGLVTWALSTLLAVIFMGATVSAIVVGGAKVSTGLADDSEPVAALVSEDIDYFSRDLLRNGGVENGADDALRNEIGAVLGHSMRAGELRDADRDHLATLVAGHTPLDRTAALERVDDVYGRAQASLERAVEAVDEARQAAAWTSIWLFVALLSGAFFAALMATVGGRQRDQVLDVEV